MKRALVAVLLASACGSNAPGDDLGTPENPVPQGEDKGPYTVATTMDFTVEQVLPPQVALVVQTLRTFSTNPAQAVIELAAESGVPVDVFYGALPSQLTDKLEGWINGELSKIKINGRTVQQYAGELAEVAQFSLTHFQVDSTLAIHLDNTSANGTATHTLTGVDFSPAGLPVRVPITNSFAQELLTQEPTIFVAEAGVFTLGEQHFGLNYGEYAWQGLNSLSMSVLGADIRTAILNAVNCPGLAQTIASKCVLGVCVGHQNELKSICEGGFNYFVTVLHDLIVEQRAEAFHFISGNAQLVDDDSDGIGDRIIDGTWDAEMNIGLGLRKAPATFTATR